MRGLPLIMGIVLLIAPAASAQDPHHAVLGFGGLQVGAVGVSDSTFGGVVTASLTPNLQIVGEGGRIGNVLASTFGPLIALSPVGFSVSAWYVEGGVRFTTGNPSGIRPYAETSAGFARMHTGIGDLGNTEIDLLTDIGLRFLDRTEPIATAGAGVTFESGAFVVDAGYRYRRIFSSDWISALSLGDTLHTNELRVGIGVRF
jgi:opacity protein-like surface antigen